MKTLFTLAILATTIGSPLLAQAAPSSRNAVIIGGQNIGSDPDVNVRFDLEREYNSRNGSF